MEKITFSEAQKMCQGTGHTLWHIRWYPPLERKYPDCSHFVVQSGEEHRDPKSHLALVIRNRAAELRHKIREWKRERRNHPMIEVYEDEIKELEAKETEPHGEP